MSITEQEPEQEQEETSTTSTPTVLARSIQMKFRSLSSSSKSGTRINSAISIHDILKDDSIFSLQYAVSTLVKESNLPHSSKSEFRSRLIGITFGFCSIMNSDLFRNIIMKTPASPNSSFSFEEITENIEAVEQIISSLVFLGLKRPYNGPIVLSTLYRFFEHLTHNMKPKNPKLAASTLSRLLTSPSPGILSDLPSLPPGRDEVSKSKSNPLDNSKFKIDSSNSIAELGYSLLSQIYRKKFQSNTMSTKSLKKMDLMLLFTATNFPFHNHPIWALIMHWFDSIFKADKNLSCFQSFVKFLWERMYSEKSITRKICILVIFKHFLSRSRLTKVLKMMQTIFDSRMIQLIIDATSNRKKFVPRRSKRSRSATNKKNAKKQESKETTSTDRASSAELSLFKSLAKSCSALLSSLHPKSATMIITIVSPILETDFKFDSKTGSPVLKNLLSPHHALAHITDPKKLIDESQKLIDEISELLYPIFESSIKSENIKEFTLGCSFLVHFTPNEKLSKFLVRFYCKHTISSILEFSIQMLNSRAPSPVNVKSQSKTTESESEEDSESEEEEAPNNSIPSYTSQVVSKQNQNPLIQVMNSLNTLFSLNPDFVISEIYSTLEKHKNSKKNPGLGHMIESNEILTNISTLCKLLNTRNLKTDPKTDPNFENHSIGHLFAQCIRSLAQFCIFFFNSMNDIDSSFSLLFTDFFTFSKNFASHTKFVLSKDHYKCSPSKFSHFTSEFLEEQDYDVLMDLSLSCLVSFPSVRDRKLLSKVICDFSPFFPKSSIDILVDTIQSPLSLLEFSAPSSSIEDEMSHFEDPNQMLAYALQSKQSSQGTKSRSKKQQQLQVTQTLHLKSKLTTLLVKIFSHANGPPQRSSDPTWIPTVSPILFLYYSKISTILSAFTRSKADISSAAKLADIYSPKHFKLPKGTWNIENFIASQAAQEEEQKAKVQEEEEESTNEIFSSFTLILENIIKNSPLLTHSASLQQIDYYFNLVASLENVSKYFVSLPDSDSSKVSKMFAQPDFQAWKSFFTEIFQYIVAHPSGKLKAQKVFEKFAFVIGQNFNTILEIVTSLEDLKSSQPVFLNFIRQFLLSIDGIVSSSSSTTSNEKPSRTLIRAFITEYPKLQNSCQLLDKSLLTSIIKKNMNRKARGKYLQETLKKVVKFARKENPALVSQLNAL